ncbi:MAG TPA: 50S ribosomal protein L6 [Candidatus Saccharimonadales bacterium]|nr:50S ribosomal protein L6 [Candidatus Saccharimonadales bacterium]
MSRIGKSPIKVPSGVNISIDGNKVTVNGPKGSLELVLSPFVKVSQNEDQLVVERNSEDAEAQAKHGLMRTLIANMIHGVSEGFTRELEVNGVGFRVSLAGTDLKMNLGYSHEVVYKLPEGITAEVKQNNIKIGGISKQKVGQVASEIRALKKPEPYKGKGIKYVEERILRKSGKSGKEAG